MSDSFMYKYWLNSTSEYVCFKDLNGKFINVSQSVAESAGFKSPEQLIGKCTQEVFSPKTAQTFMSQDQHVINTRKVLVEDTWIDHPKLGLILLEITKTPMFDENGNLIGIQAISRNITEKNQLKNQIDKQEYMMQTILDNVPAAIWVKDKDNNYVVVNKEYEAFYKVHKDDILGEAVNKILNSENLFSDDNLKILIQQDEEVRTSHKTIKLKMNTAEEKSRLVEITKAPILTQEGDCIGLVGISYEVNS